jgi:hypothetical protein
MRGQGVWELPDDRGVVVVAGMASHTIASS